MPARIALRELSLLEERAYAPSALAVLSQRRLVQRLVPLVLLERTVSTVVLTLPTLRLAVTLDAPLAARGPFPGLERRHAPLAP